MQISDSSTITPDFTEIQLGAKVLRDPALHYSEEFPTSIQVFDDVSAWLIAFQTL